MNYEVNDFQVEVIDHSKTQPVVVDFWAPWRGPCRVLGPSIEKLASETTRWKLVKVNTDEHQEISGRFQIRGIPAVKMFKDGEVIAEFTGALPEHQIQQWLDDHLPAPPEEEEVSSKIDLLMLQKEWDKARELASKSVEKYPENKELRVKLIKLLLPKYIQRAEKIFEPLKHESSLVELYEQFETFRQLKKEYADPQSLPKAKTDTIEEEYKKALKSLFNQNFEKAVDQFLEVLINQKNYNDEMARKAILAIFKLLGEEHEITKSRRRRFSMALY